MCRNSVRMGRFLVLTLSSGLVNKVQRKSPLFYSQQMTTKKKNIRLATPEKLEKRLRSWGIFYLVWAGISMTVSLATGGFSLFSILLAFAAMMLMSKQTKAAAVSILVLVLLSIVANIAFKILSDVAVPVFSLFSIFGLIGSFSCINATNQLRMITAKKRKNYTIKKADNVS